MKKLITMVLLAVFAAGCTATSVQEEAYENNIQLIDKKKVKNPTQKGD